jgi:hypothetical protein
MILDGICQKIVPVEKSSQNDIFILPRKDKRPLSAESAPFIGNAAETEVGYEKARI